MADEIIHEVEEALKQEKIEKLWKEYGSYLIAGIVLAVLITGLISGWNSWNNKVNSSQTTMLIQSLEGNNQPSRLSSLAESLRPGHRAVARLTAAGLLLQNKKMDEALLEYQSIAGDQEIEKIFRDLAQIMFVRLKFSIEEQEASVQVLLSKLQPIWQDTANPWRHHAHLQAALLKAHGQNDFSGAIDHLNEIRLDPKVPASLSERAYALEHIYKLKSETANPEIKNEDPEG